MSTRVPLLLLSAVICLQCCYSATIPRGYDPRLSDDVMMTPKKRPFCNAFTGCGRKRSLLPPGMPVQEILRQRQLEEEGFGSVPDLPSDAALEEFSRQMLSEAKLWEAIQEASAELARRKQKDLALSAQ
ncbi:Cardioactive peptide [Eumeta japonica]|uniref:Cardioactive peptide n=1 Tax=Eumeta variegata TaxID=151549 RepID=A0A4C1T6T0_EUMVA|nr:Cardioactive peptide [Eumeta japonica]